MREREGVRGGGVRERESVREKGEGEREEYLTSSFSPSSSSEDISY